MIYHQGPSKNLVTKWMELYAYFLKEGKINIHYYTFGLNLKSRRSKSYISPKAILKLKNNAENLLKKKAGVEKIQYDVITKDKFMAASFFKANNIPHIPVLALIKDGRVFWMDASEESVSSLRSLRGVYFIKNTTEEAGDGVFHLNITEDEMLLNDHPYDVDKLSRLLKDKIWILQKSATACKQIRQLNESALNTTRIVTILDGNQPVYLTGFQSIATRNEKTDSWSKGSVYVGIDADNNCLKKEGYLHPGVSELGLVLMHPDSNIKFSKYKIDDLSAAVELCIRAHRRLYFNFIIGWDIALTDEGPMILEANEKPGMNAVQCVDGGLNMKIKSYYNKIMKS